MASELKEAFEAQADWRAEKAEEYPDDVRNVRATEILRRLAATADDVPAALMAEYNAVFLRWDTYEVVRLQDEAMRGIGFHTQPENAADFVRGFVEMANADRRRFEPPRLRSTN